MSQEVIGPYADGRFKPGRDAGSAEEPLDSIYVDNVHLSTSLIMTASPGDNALLRMPTSGTDLTWLGGTSGDLLYAADPQGTSDGFTVLAKRSGSKPAVLGFNTSTPAPIWREGTAGGGNILYKNTSNQFGFSAALGTSSTEYFSYDGSGGMAWDTSTPGITSPVQVTVFQYLLTDESGNPSAEMDGLRDFHQNGAGAEISVPMKWASYPEKRMISYFNGDVLADAGRAWGNTSTTYISDYAVFGVVGSTADLYVNWTGKGPNSVSISNNMVVLNFLGFPTLPMKQTDADANYTTMQVAMNGASSDVGQVFMARATETTINPPGDATCITGYGGLFDGLVQYNTSGQDLHSTVADEALFLGVLMFIEDVTLTLMGEDATIITTV